MKTFIDIKVFNNNKYRKLILYSKVKWDCL